MTTIDLYRKHKAGDVSREKFLYEVRRDNNLPFITNLTSYDDAVKILKNKGIVTENQTKEAKKDEAVKAEVKPKKVTEKKLKELHIDQANPYEYRHGIQHELCELDDYSDEALEKAKDKVLKNLAKDANYYSNLLNTQQSPFEFKKSETDAKGMQAKADGHLKKELKKNDKSNVKDTLGKKEAGKKKPKGVKVMPDKGVTGSEKTIKEGLNEYYSEDYDFFIDNILDILLTDKVITQYDIEALNNGDNDILMNALNDEWKTFEKYEENGQSISTSDLSLAARNIAQKINSTHTRRYTGPDEFFGESKEDKLSKIKEALKKALKQEAGEKTGVITFQSGQTKAVDYKNDEELRKIGDNSDVKSLETGGGKKVKGS